MVDLENVGLIINPKAGKGEENNYAAARACLANLRVLHVHTCEGGTGVETLKGMDVSVTAYSIPQPPSREHTQTLARKLANAGLDAVVVVGGDGTLADVAGVFANIEDSPPILGVGTGSTNAGGLVSFLAPDLYKLVPEGLAEQDLAGLIASLNGQGVGIGFNDCVLGMTVVATVGEDLMDVDLAEMLAGRKVPGVPRSVGNDKTVVEIFRGGDTEVFAKGAEVATVVIGLAEPAFVAKAITGGACLTAFTGLEAGCLVADQPLVRVGVSTEQIIAMPPIRSAYVSLGSGQMIRVQGVSEGTGLCVDGNPLRLLKQDDLIEFRVKPRAVRSLQPIYQG